MSNKVNDVQPGRQLTGAHTSGCPRGLEYLTQVDQLLVHQQIQLIEILTGFEQNNKYAITNSLGQQAYYAVESTECMMRQCCGGGRAFELSVLDNTGLEVLHVSRPLRCGCCWGPASCFHTVSVTAGGMLLGIVQQAFSYCKPEIDVLNANGEPVLHISGPCCPCGCVDIPFIIKGLDGTEIGRITKQFRGCLTEWCSRADRFGVTFPMDLDVNVKATLIGALFLIDFMFFEENKS